MVRGTNPVRVLTKVAASAGPRTIAGGRATKRPQRNFEGRGFTLWTTAWAVIQGIEAVQMIRKGQVLGITRKNRHGQAWVFGALLGII